MTAERPMFAVIADNLMQLRLEVEGQSGNQIRAMGDAQGMIPDLVRSIVTAIIEALDWLYSTALSVESFAIASDAALAALEVLADSIEALGEGFTFDGLSDSMGLPAEPFEKIGEGIQLGSSVLKSGLAIASILPRPEDVRRIRDELELSLGNRANPELEMPGSLALLVDEIATA